jgi:two-component system cell cycle response regulator
MERLIRQAIKTVADLCQKKPVTLLSIEDKQKGIIIGGWIKGECILPHTSFQIKNTPIEKILLTKQAQTSSGTVVESLPFPANKETKSAFSCLCLPLLSEDGNQIKGVVVIAQKRGSPITADQLQALETIIPLIAAVVEASVENEQLIQLSTKDGLTQLYARHYFERRLLEEFTRVRRHGGVFSILIIDVDHFKQINDTCGYKEGNRVLHEIGKLLGSTIRKEIDIPCRYSGKQFTLLLPSTSVDGAYILAERIRKRCEYHRFTTEQGIPIKVTVSIGIAHNVDIAHHEILEQNDDNSITEISKEELIHRADMMLHAAKQAGRNQVMVWW